MTADPLADVLRNAHEGRFKNAYVDVPEVGVPLEMFAALQADAIRAALRDGTLADRLAMLRWIDPLAADVVEALLVYEAEHDAAVARHEDHLFDPNGELFARLNAATSAYLNPKEAPDA